MTHEQLATVMPHAVQSDVAGPLDLLGLTGSFVAVGAAGGAALTWLVSGKPLTGALVGAGLGLVATRFVNS